ncbi:MAG: hypothetical protein AB7F40_04440 [Victivallaceae bacterium]
MADNEKRFYDEEKFYDEEIIPIINSLIAKCEERKLPMVVHVNYAETETGGKCGTSHHISTPDTPIGRTVWLASQILRRQKLDERDILFLMLNDAYNKDENSEDEATEEDK